MTQLQQFMDSMAILFLLVLIGIIAGYWALNLVMIVISRLSGPLPPATPENEQKIMDEINRGLRKFK